ncbi:5974_t:CDS:2, partial [Racocetra persica]
MSNLQTSTQQTTAKSVQLAQPNTQANIINPNQPTQDSNSNAKAELANQEQSSIIKTNEVILSQQQTLDAQLKQIVIPTDKNQNNYWVEEISNTLEKCKKETFNHETWNNDNILKALTEESLFKKLINHKLQTTIPNINIPKAIANKLKYCDTVFFKLFTRDRGTQPSYQLEFNILMNIVLERYRCKHNVVLVNKTNQVQIYNKLRKKITIDSILTLNIAQYGDHVSTQYIFYLINFGKIETTIEFEQVYKLISQAQAESHTDLPENLNKIQVDILDIFPFILLLNDNSKIVAVVQSLRLIYIFTSLPDSYFVNARTFLPNYPSRLHSDIKAIFLIKEYSNLQYLAEYRKKLQKYYIIKEKLPITYFNLPSEKLNLSSTSQELKTRVKYLFSCKSKSESEFRDL